MTQQTQLPPVLIAGAGPTGLTLAISLTLQDIPCRIIDKLATATAQSRAAGIHARSLEIFRQLGIVDETIQQGVQAHAIAIHAGGKQIAHLDYTMADSPYNFAIMLPQTDTEAILTQRLTQLGIKIEREVELIEFHQENAVVSAQLQHSNGDIEQITAPYLFGCDGAHSIVRKSLDVAFVGKTIEEHWSLADVTATWNAPHDELHIYLSDAGVLLIFPLGNDRFRIATNFRAHGVSAEAELTLEEFQSIADSNLTIKMMMKETSWLSFFSINYRKASQYHQGRVFLLGDAAHIHSPAGGQGMNTGMQDAFNLAWKITAVIKNEAKPTLLDSYYAERSAVAESVLKDTERLTNMVTLKNPLLKFLRNNIMPILTKHKKLQHQLIKKMSQVGIHYAPSQIISEDWLGKKYGAYSNSGYRAANLSLTNPTTQQTVELHSVLEAYTYYAVIFLPDEQFNAEVLGNIKQLMKRLPHQFKTIIITTSAKNCTAIQQAYPNTTALLDIKQYCRLEYDIEVAAIYIIRPDGYIAYRNQPLSAQSVLSYLEK